MVTSLCADGLAGPSVGICGLGVLVAAEDGAGSGMWGEGFGITGGPVIQFCEDEGWGGVGGFLG